MRIILFGPPGVGKDTQGSLLATSLAVPFISTSILFRDEAAGDTERGRLLARYLTAGSLVPDEVVVAVVRERLAGEDIRSGFVMEGFPRTIPQAQMLDRLSPLDAAVHLVADRDTLLARLRDRLTCQRCHAVYHLRLAPPACPGTCDRCGAPLYRRADQDPDIVRRRLDDYESHTAPLAGFYGRTGVLVTVRGEGTIPEVRDRLARALGGPAVRVGYRGRSP